MSQLGVMLQESVRRESRTLLFLLRDTKMDGGDSRRTRSWTERLGFNGMGCCGGATWSSRSDTIEDEEEQFHDEITIPDQNPVCLNENSDSEPEPEPVPSGMNLAAALAAERQLRATPNEPVNNDCVNNTWTPPRVSLMKLLEETDGCDEKEKGSDNLCCVCMVRNKAAAFIPCGHTYCRVCSRELWLNRGSCPLCNRRILEILDIF
ncbi:hypothetical protein ACFE04_002802 [Oxalis oulophora]